MERSLWALLGGTFTLRFSTALTGAMLGFYFAHLTEFHPDAQPVDAAMVGLFAATFYVAELILSPIFGILGDRLGHHRVMLWGPFFGAVAVLLTAATGNFLVLGATRLLEGGSTASSIPSILGYIAILTAGNEALRGRASARFEGATLAGLGAGFIVAPMLFERIGTIAFVLNAVIYGISLLIYLFGVKDVQGERDAAKRDHTSVRDYARLLTHSHVLLLAPTWIAVNAAIGMWFSQSLFQLAREDPRFPDQWLKHGFTAGEITIGAILVAIVFGIGILWWGNRFDRFRRTSIITLGVVGGVALAIAGVIVNHTVNRAESNPALLIVVIAAIAIAALGLFALAGATPAAIGLLADVSEAFPGDRGAIMGLYSVFLGIGQIVGSLLGGFAAEWRGMDGLLAGTGLLLLIALLPLWQLRRAEHYIAGPAAVASLD